MQPEPLPKPASPKKSKFTELQSTVDPGLLQLWKSEQSYIRNFLSEQDAPGWTPDHAKLIAGVDLSAAIDNQDAACVGLVIWDSNTRSVVYESFNIVRVSQPYVPGCLAFRQIPPLLHLFNSLKATKPQFWPDLVIVDGNGILHHNACGLACHLGFLLDLPCLGVGKTFFDVDGMHKGELGQFTDGRLLKAGDFVELKGKSGRIWAAAVLNSEGASNPVFVSVGHKISLRSAIECVRRFSIYRVVEPVRLADKKTRAIISNFQGSVDQLPTYDMPYLHTKQAQKATLN